MPQGTLWPLKIACQAWAEHLSCAGIILHARDTEADQMGKISVLWEFTLQSKETDNNNQVNMLVR